MSGGRVELGLGCGLVRRRARRVRHPVPVDRRALRDARGAARDRHRPVDHARRRDVRLRRHALPRHRLARAAEAGAAAASADHHRRLRHEAHAALAARVRRRVQPAVRAGRRTSARACEHVRAACETDRDATRRRCATRSRSSRASDATTPSSRRRADAIGQEPDDAARTARPARPPRSSSASGRSPRPAPRPCTSRSSTSTTSTTCGSSPPKSRPTCRPGVCVDVAVRRAHRAAEHDHRRAARAVGRIEALGFDWISIWDHFYAADATGDPQCLEAITTHAALAVDDRTRHVRLARLLRRLPPPRGARERDGDARPARRTAASCSASAAAGCRASTTRTASTTGRPANGCACSTSTSSACAACSPQDRTTFEGEFFTLTDAQCEPKPVQARLPIWIGGGGEKVTLRIAAQHADGWNVPFIAPDVWAHKASVLDEHCDTARPRSGDDHEDGQRRHGVHRRRAEAPVRADAELREAGRAVGQRAGDGRQGRRVRRRRRRVGDPRDARAVRPRRPRTLRRRGDAGRAVRG